MEGENGKPPTLGVAEVMEGADDCVVPEEAVVELEFVRELTGLAGRVVRLGGNEEVLGFVTGVNPGPCVHSIPSGGPCIGALLKPAPFSHDG